MEHQEMTVTPHVYSAISHVTASLAKIGIEKSRKASAGPASYYFRGIDDVYNAIAHLLPEHGLVIIPRVVGKEVVERKTGNDRVIYNVSLMVEFDLVSVHDGSSHTAVAVGEAMDSGDKASNKAMSAAYKYMAIQVFAIPTEGDNDTENDTGPDASIERWTRLSTQVNGALSIKGLEEIWKAAAAECKSSKDLETYNALKRMVVAKSEDIKAAEAA